YEGDLEIALIPTDFSTDILGEILDSNGVLVERNDDEVSQFALLFEFTGDKRKIRHVLYCCSASRPATEGQTTEDSKEVKTETISIKASALPNGLVKAKTCESTDASTYDGWYKNVYTPAAGTTSKTTVKA
ncbi:MAG: major tail protein, partial [[Eubacterium] siraeum]|nr:major tail protein [[Eubacterium] siraeum]